MTFEQWWDSTGTTATPHTYKGWEESCRQAWEAGAAAERTECTETDSAYDPTGWVKLKQIADAAQNLIDQKGRHNTQIAYERLTAALKTPNAQ